MDYFEDEMNEYMENTSRCVVSAGERFWYYYFMISYCF